jgi:Kef-type K+ transport system membrane component KefB
MELPVTDPIYQFALLVTAALLVQLTLERIRLPGITGLLVIGMLLGPGGMGVLPREPVVSFLGSVGTLARATMLGLTIPQAAATLAVTVTAAEAGILGEEIVDAIIIVIFVTCLSGPVLTGWAGKRLAQSSEEDR